MQSAKPLCLVFALLSLQFAPPVLAEGEAAHPTILFLSSYAYDWDSVPEQLSGAIILEDDAALDFALEYRNELFAGVPMVFEGISTAEKANLAHEDPLITGMVECFPYRDTIELARKLYPQATQIVSISDASAAANQVLEILGGTSPADIPVETMSGYPMFDQKMLDCFGIC